MFDLKHIFKTMWLSKVTECTHIASRHQSLPFGLIWVYASYA